MLSCKYWTSRILKAALTDMRYLARSKFSERIVQINNFGLIWPAVFRLGYCFVKGGRLPLMSLNELEENRKRQLFSVNLWTNHNQPLTGLRSAENVFYWPKFKARSHGIFFSWSLIFFWLTLVYIYCLEFISHYIKEM